MDDMSFSRRVSIEDFWRAMQQLQEEINTFRRVFK